MGISSEDMEDASKYYEAEGDPEVTFVVFGEDRKTCVSRKHPHHVERIHHAERVRRGRVVRRFVSCFYQEHPSNVHVLQGEHGIDSEISPSCCLAFTRCLAERRSIFSRCYCRLSLSWHLFVLWKVKEQMQMLRRLYLAVSGLPSEEQTVELPDDLTVEKMVTVVTAFFKASNNVIEQVIQELLAKVRCIKGNLTLVTGTFVDNAVRSRETTRLFGNLQGPPAESYEMKHDPGLWRATGVLRGRFRR